MSLASIVTRGFASGGSIALIVSRGYGIGDVVPIEEIPIGGGDDAWYYKVKSKALEKKEDLAAALRALYNALPEEEKLEVKAVVAQYAETKTPRRMPVPVANIDFAKLAKSIAAMEALLNVYAETFQLDFEDEWESTFLLLAA